MARTEAGARPEASERGSVTVEAALALCSLLVLFALVLAGVAAVSDQLRCTNAAVAAARLAARGEPHLAEQAALDAAPAGAAVEIRHVDGTVQVIVRADPAGGLLPGVTVRGEAHAVPEPGVEAADADPG
ncbi:hypothetical protein B0I33_102673 [Prauserella shujinwangii]|uniref:TadE-like protein n=1 Tax=Prauserella shujinwangii TaxID=1453103 RepID=A0A2T0M1S4_9PSEU|nr:TadE family type IV pilus minor pilin [Prauserella shujinwangii]PRX50549.1 hypothetical protein B0I33_102673 [Prauserella shujinwangii]